LRGAVRRAAVAMGHDALETILALLIGNNRAAHIERLLLARRVEMRVKALGVAMPDFNFRAGYRLAICSAHGAVHDQGLAVGVAAIVQAGEAMLHRRAGDIQRAFNGAWGAV